jgi:hypothetical protein
MLIQEERIFPVPIPLSLDNFPILGPETSSQNMSLSMEIVYEEIAKLR